MAERTIPNGSCECILRGYRLGEHNQAVLPSSLVVVVAFKNKITTITTTGKMELTQQSPTTAAERTSLCPLKKEQHHKRRLTSLTLHTYYSICRHTIPIINYAYTQAWPPHACTPFYMHTQPMHYFNVLKLTEESLTVTSCIMYPAACMYISNHCSHTFSLLWILILVGRMFCLFCRCKHVCCVHVSHFISHFGMHLYEQMVEMYIKAVHAVGVWATVKLT